MVNDASLRLEPGLRSQCCVPGRPSQLVPLCLPSSFLFWVELCLGGLGGEQERLFLFVFLEKKAGNEKDLLMVGRRRKIKLETD